MEHNRMMDVRDRMKKCIRKATADRMEQGSAEEAFFPMDKIRNIVQLEKCVDWIADTYEEPLEKMHTIADGYYLNMYAIPAGHEIFTLGTIYVLLCAGAKIWLDFDREYEEKYNPLILLNAFEEEFEEISHVGEYDDIEELLDGLKHEHHVTHGIAMGDCPNMSWICGKINDCGLTVHAPGAHIIVVDYSTEDLPEEEHRLLGAFGNKCWNEVIDYDGYNGENNRNKKYYGFDYGDLFWNHYAVMSTWKEYSRKEKLTVVLFTDRPDGGDLPEDIGEYAAVYRPDEETLNVPMYDFMQLLQYAYTGEQLRHIEELKVWFGGWDGNSDDDACRELEKYDTAVIFDVLTDLEEELQERTGREFIMLELLQKYSQNLLREYEKLTGEGVNT